MCRVLENRSSEIASILTIKGTFDVENIFFNY